MILRLLIVLLLLPFSADDGDEDGRRGNEFYAQQQYKLAAEAYGRGLAALSEETPRFLRYGLLNNLGAALLKSGDAQGAGDAFSRALNSAPAPADVARTSYNAGNASFAAQDLESALAHYRESLLADQANEDAKFNYEFVKRRMQQQQQQEQQQKGDQQDDEQQGEQEQEGGDQNQEQEQQEQQDDGSQQEQQESPSEQEQQEERQGRQDPSPDELSDEQAERILQALQNEEEQLLRQVQRPKTRPRQVEKDW